VTHKVVVVRMGSVGYHASAFRRTRASSWQGLQAGRTPAHEKRALGGVGAYADIASMSKG
jgi:hypothetical protein